MPDDMGGSDFSYASIKWSDTKDWRLYYIYSKGSFAYSVDTLKYFKYINLNQDSMQLFLHEVTEIPKERTPLWMGYYIASCRLSDGTLVKIEISQYGRFFYEEKERRYYQLKEDIGQDWLSYLTRSWIMLEDASK
jgi:hypothetical protein